MSKKNPFLEVAVFFRQLDGSGNLVSEPVKIVVDEHGHADLSALPEKERAHFQEVGIKDELGLGRVFPVEGERFVKLLQKFSGRQWYAASKPEPETT